MSSRPSSSGYSAIRSASACSNSSATASEPSATSKQSSTFDSSGTSQHLAALRQQGVLESRRAGTSVYYRIRDPRVTQLLAVAKQILTSALSDSHALLSDLAEEATPQSRRR